VEIAYRNARNTGNRHPTPGAGPGPSRGHSMLPVDSVGEDHESALELFGGIVDPGGYVRGPDGVDVRSKYAISPTF
jgi:hypothetical protein